ncbi:NGO_0222 family membrane protein [Stenoxybacter acetivorans]|uniref:NGO_0222 family membrane protein n=1 Tax=Stenoxybacter acetivorans TaxID=422441 RepID=UPI0005685910|nr:NGO_0222 family membrane protein [Stenoxybacter acetivorans]
MKKNQTFLLLIASFTLMFIGLVALGGYFWTQSQKGISLVCFLLSFAAVIGQMASLALFLRERSFQAARLSQYQIQTQKTESKS